ncbi:MAG: thioredoxin-like domain-containing protein [Bacteroidales bacterium]
MNRINLLILLMTISISVIGQKFSLKLEIENIPEKEIYLANFYGEKNNIVDTAMPVEGKIIFPLKSDYHEGLYRIFLDKDIFFDIIYNKENIEIKTDYEDLYEKLVVVTSVENKIYYDFLRKGNDYRRKFDLLAPVNDYFPKTDSFFFVARTKFLFIQAEFLEYIDKTVKKNPDAWATKIIKQKRPLYYNPTLDEYGRKEYAVEHYFDNMDFTDVELLRSNVYTTIAIEYMTLFSNPSLTQDQLENEFIKAVDKIMYEAMDNSIVYEFIVEYLVSGFERFHFDKVLDYIAENYNPEQCENEERKNDLQTRLEKYAELTIGKPGPEIAIPDMDGNITRLSEITSEYTLIVFWASWCPHCAESLPSIDNIYQTVDRSKLEVVAISLDKEKDKWESSVQELNFTWKDCCDLKGWDSQAAIDYNVYATPTMFLLDHQKNIVAKPITINELKNALTAENIIN